MKVNTTRFGELQVNKEDVINFQEGLLGFENLKKFFVVDPGDSTLILWLQSIDDEKVAFPIIERTIGYAVLTADLGDSHTCLSFLENGQYLSFIKFRFLHKEFLP